MLTAMSLAGSRRETAAPRATPGVRRARRARSSAASAASVPASHAADEDHVRMAEHPAMQPLAGGRADTRPPARARRSPLVHQVVADVRASRGRPRRRLDARAGELDGAARRPRPRRRPVRLAMRSTDVAVPVAGGEGHPRVEARRDRSRSTASITLCRSTKRRQSQRRDGAQTGDAVRHHDLRQRQPLGGACGRVLGAQRLVRDPALEPDEGREGPGDAGAGAGSGRRRSA